MLDPVSQYIVEAAQRRGIDPRVALRVAGSEGLHEYTGDGGSSFGPFQLHYGGVAAGGNRVAGLGDDFTKATGLNARDPSTVRAQIDFALDHAAKHGWGAFHGAAKVGLDNWAGIGNPASGSGRYDALTGIAGGSDPTKPRPMPGAASGGGIGAPVPSTMQPTNMAGGGGQGASLPPDYQAMFKPRGPGLLGQLLFGNGGFQGMLAQHMPNGIFGSLTGLNSTPPGAPAGGQPTPGGGVGARLPGSAMPTSMAPPQSTPPGPQSTPPAPQPTGATPPAMPGMGMNATGASNDGLMALLRMFGMGGQGGGFPPNVGG